MYWSAEIGHGAFPRSWRDVFVPTKFRRYIGREKTQILHECIVVNLWAGSRALCRLHGKRQAMAAADGRVVTGLGTIKPSVPIVDRSKMWLDISSSW